MKTTVFALLLISAAAAFGQNVPPREPAQPAPMVNGKADAPRIATPPRVRIRLPERFRLLTDQRFDLRVEVAGLDNVNANLRITLDNVDVTAQLPAPEISTDNDADASTQDCAWVYRRWSFSRAGVHELKVTVTDGARRAETEARIGVQAFQLAPDFKNIVLFIGDGMGTAYRDAARIVWGSANNRLREGFFDEMLQMDQMPVSGMILTHSLDRLAPDSADTASAWATGNKAVANSFGCFPDNNDHRYNPRDMQNTKQFALDNPRVETLWEYLKRRHDYRAGIVTTADVTDATAAASAAHSTDRTLYDDIARQYVDGAPSANPAFDVILGGGREHFTARTRERSGDTRNLADELQAAGWTYVQTRSELKAAMSETAPKAPRPTLASIAPPHIAARSADSHKLLGLFRAGTMSIAYDKLNLARPSNEVRPTSANESDQPFLDEMTEAALHALRQTKMPFILLVEAASIDKRSHSNDPAGQIWDTIELDRAIGVARRIIAGDERLRSRTLLIATADHDQSMSILGTIDTQNLAAVENVRSTQPYPAAAANGDMEHSSVEGEVARFPDYKDANGDGYPENTNRYRLGVGYRTPNHTASCVPLTAEGSGALIFTGYFDQTDIFFKFAQVLGSDTSALDEALNELRKIRTINANYGQKR